MKRYMLIVLCVWSAFISKGQDSHLMSEDFLPVTDELEPQPILAQVMRLSDALTVIGNPLPPHVQQKLLSLKNQTFSIRTTNQIQELLDPYCLFGIEINPEARVKVVEGSATPELIQGGWRSYLVKIYNQAAVTAALAVNSPNSEPTLFRSTFAPSVKDENLLSPGQVEDRFLELVMYNKRSMKRKLSGLKLEFAIVQIYTKSTNQKEAKIGSNIGPGTQDIGFRNTVDILFKIKPSVKTILRVHDSNGPTIGSFIFMDRIERVHVEDNDDPIPDDYRLTVARMRSWEESGFNSISDWLSVMFGKPAFPYDSVISNESKLIGIYPLPSKRLALTDEYPDLFFQPQI